MLAGSYKRELSSPGSGREKFRRKGDADLIPTPPVGDYREDANDVNCNANPDELHIPEDEFTDSPSSQQHNKDTRHLESSSSLSDSDSERYSKTDAGMTTPPPPKPQKQYCAFVRQLRKKHPETKETVNQIKKRPTAVDMIKQDSKRQAEEAK